MFLNLRRSTRKDIFLPVTISVEQANTGSALQESFPGHITNISKHGACLFIPTIIKGGFHLFHSTREDNSLMLRLAIPIHPEKENYTVTAHPIWFDIFQDNEQRGFKIGIEFTEPPTEEFLHSL